MTQRSSTIAESLSGILLGRNSMVLMYPSHRIVIGADISIDAGHLGERSEILMASAHEKVVPAAALLWHLADSDGVVVEGDISNLRLTFPCGCTMAMVATGDSPEDVALYSRTARGEVMDRWPTDY